MPVLISRCIFAATMLLERPDHRELRGLVMRCFNGSGLGLSLGNTFGDEDIVFRLLFLLMVQFTLLEGVQVTTTLETKGCNNSLNLRSLGIGFRVFLLALDLPSNNIFSNVILLTEIEKLPNLRRTLRTESLRKYSVGQVGDLGITLFDNNQGKDGNIRSNDAAANGLASTLASAARSVARVSVGKKEPNTIGQENTLLHWETLLVVTTSDAKNVSFPLVSKRVSWNFLRDFLVKKYTVSFLIIYVEELLGPSCRVSNIELHT